MLVTVEIDPARRTAAFREVSYLAAGDSCRVVLDGVRGADFGSLALLLYRDAASESPVASCSPFSPVAGHPALADGELALDTAEMAAWFGDAVPAAEESDDSDDAPSRPSASAGPRLAARASLAERSVRADGWLVVLDRDRTWAACRVPVLLRPGAGASGVVDPTSVRALVEGLVSAALAGKADKAPPAAPGNLASLGADGNLADSGATPASIKAAAVAEVVANAPGTMDTLREIADILGSSQQAGTVLKRISDLETGKADSSSLAAVATSGSYDDLSGKPAIPAPVAVDATLTASGAAADAKAVGDALRSGFTEWEFTGVPDGHSVKILRNGVFASLTIKVDDMPYGMFDSVGDVQFVPNGKPNEALSMSVEGLLVGGERVNVAATRHLITPTKTSQLTNDGDGTGAFAAVSELGYAVVSVPVASGGTGALSDRAVNRVSLGGTAGPWKLTVPPAVSGRSRSFYVELTPPSSTSTGVYSCWPYLPDEVTVLTYNHQASGFGTFKVSDGALVFRFTEVSADVFRVENVTLGNKVDADRVSSGTLASARIPSLDASKIGSGTLDAARLPAATDSAKGVVQVDRTTITALSGTISVNPGILSYSLAPLTPSNGVVTLVDRAVNLVSPTVTVLQPVWEWSDGEDHGQPAYGVIEDNGDYQEYGWGFSGEGGTLSNYDSFGNYYDFVYDSDDAAELSFYSYNTDATIVASLVTPYETDVSSLALPPAVTGKVRDFMVRLAMPEHATMFSWPSGVVFETEDGQMPDVSEPGVYLLAFTESSAGSDRFELFCRKVQGVE